MLGRRAGREMERGGGRGNFLVMFARLTVSALLIFLKGPAPSFARGTPPPPPPPPMAPTTATKGMLASKTTPGMGMKGVKTLPPSYALAHGPPPSSRLAQSVVAPFGGGGRGGDEWGGEERRDGEFVGAFSFLSFLLFCAVFDARVQCEFVLEWSG